MIPTATALHYLARQALLELGAFPGALATPVEPLFTVSGALGRLRQCAADRVAADFRDRIVFATGHGSNVNTAYRKDLRIKSCLSLLTDPKTAVGNVRASQPATLSAIRRYLRVVSPLVAIAFRDLQRNATAAE